MSNPKKPVDAGQNRTGIGRSPIDGSKLVDAARAAVPNPSFSMTEIQRLRLDISRRVEPLGTMPPPVTLKGVAKSAVQKVKGHAPNVLIDMLGERLAFERTGTRLYEALLVKHEASDKHPSGPTRDELEQIRDEELMHVDLLIGAMERLGADPTAVTPSADACAVASSGLIKLVTDPRTTFTQALHAAHIAELTDNDAWLLLADLTDRIGEDELAASFRQALIEEEEHLAHVRAWLASALEGAAGVEPRKLWPELTTQPGAP
jgi:hypothetical protein